VKLGLTSLVRAAAVGLVLSRVARAARTRPPVAACGAPPGTVVSVVIPARNEAARIGPLLDVVVGAPGVDEVIVVDDESTDATPQLASDAGARIVAAGRRPTGWAGKSWALQRGLEAASGDWIVTLDADARPHPDLLGSLVARAHEDRTDLLTVTGRFDGSSKGARWLHAALLTTLVYRFGPPGRRSPPAVDRILANGQCMAFRRAYLLSLGGFEPVAGSVVEDVALARHLADIGRRVDLLDASALLNVELYESFGATWSGWGRSIGLPGVESRGRQLCDVVTLALTLPLPMLRLVSGRADPIDVVALATRIGALAGTKTAFTRRDASYWLSPLGDLVAVGAVTKSILARTHTWSGRTYRL
jgi:dolichol-phosphate mannosyltransferase